MASPTRWTWVWVSSGSCWWTRKPCMLQSMGLQRFGHNWVTELNWEFSCPGHPVLGVLCPLARALNNLWRLCTQYMITYLKCLTLDFSEGSPSQPQLPAAGFACYHRLTFVYDLSPWHTRSHAQPLVLSNLSISLSLASQFLAVISLVSGNAKMIGKVIFLSLWWYLSMSDWWSNSTHEPTQWNTAVRQLNISLQNQPPNITA